MNGKIAIMIIAGLLLHGCATQQAVPVAKPSHAEAQAKYGQLREQYESGAVGVGIRDVRLAYVQTPHYAPYGGATDASLRALARLANSGDFKGCLDEVRSLEPHAFPTLELHHYGWMCASEANAVEEALRHERMARAIFSDITADGDGKSPEAAWRTISTNELYLVLAIQGLKPTGQALVQQNGRAYDVMTVEPQEGGSEESRYFDITLQMSHGLNFLDDRSK